MKCIKKHIASFLLLGFLFPQVANALHYLIIPHEFTSEKQVVFSSPVYEYHTCDYHLSGIKFLIPTFDHSGEYRIPESKQEAVTRAFLRYPKNKSFHFSVRGPPYTIRTSHFKENII